MVCKSVPATLQISRGPPMPPNLRIELTELFRDDILDQQDLLDHDLSAWLTAPN